MTTRPANTRPADSRTPGSRDGQQTTELRDAMLRIADEMGCQLRPQANNPSMLRGLCPFHEAGTIADSKTLEMDTRNPRFWCQKCQATGNPIAFAAMAWGVSARDAHQLLQENRNAGRERPDYPDRHHQKPTPENAANAPQNTAVLTRATAYYGRQARRSYPALYLLAKLGVTPDQAARIGLGYCEGQGLRKHLQDSGIGEKELTHSPLFHELVDTETFAGRIVISDLDFTGATLWMTSIAPEEPEAGYGWRERKPSMFGLPGRKMYLMNLYSISSRTTEGALTDDPRLYAVLAANGIPAALITQRRRTNQNLKNHCERVVQALKQKGMTKVVLAVHDRQQAHMIIQMMAEAMPGVDVAVRTRASAARELAPHARDLESFMDFGRDERGELRDEEPETRGEPEDYGSNPGNEDWNENRNENGGGEEEITKDAPTPGPGRAAE